MPRANKSLSLPDLKARFILLRENSHNAIVTSLGMQLDAARMILALVQNQLVFEDKRANYIRFASKIVCATETKLWKSALNPSEILSISAEIERLWFQIDAL
jgi:hypothetical protein